MSSPPERGFVLIAALSGRALAAAARRAGYRPLVADLFGDLDTARSPPPPSACPAASPAASGGAALLAALDRLAAGRSPVGLVCGAGFEDRTALLAAIGRRHRLLGNPPETVRARQEPDRLRRPLCPRRACRIRRSSDASRAPTGVGWRSARAARAACMSGRSAPVPRLRPRTLCAAPRRRAAGLRPVARRRPKRALVLGFSEQWCAPAPGRPFRYGGAVRPATLPARDRRRAARGGRHG